MDSINTRENITAFEFWAQPILTLRIRLAFGWWLYMLIPHWLALMWLIDMDFYNNRDDHCYALQYNDGLQIIQWSNITISWMSIDSIAKFSLIILCISVIVPFRFYQIDCMIVSIDGILSINHSIDYLSLMIGNTYNTNHE